MHRINLTLVYFLLFSLVSAAWAYRIALSAYDNVINTTYDLYE